MRGLPKAVIDDLRSLLSLIQSERGRELHGGAGAGGDQVSDPSRLPQIAQWLYATWYCTPAAEATTARWPLGRSDLSSGLRSSTAGSTRFETQWVAMRAAPDGRCLVARGDALREVRPGAYANRVRPGAPVAPGEAVWVSACVDWVDPQTTFWFLQSSAGPPAEPLIRLYWNVSWDRVGLALRAVTEALDRSGAPYLLKCPSWAGGYVRADSLVVYLERDRWPGLKSEIRAAAMRARVHLRGSWPPLTLRIAPGVGFAEDPGSKAQESFGESRCRALAPAVLELLRDPPSSPRAGIARLSEALRRAGVDPARPWQNGDRDAQA
jgi:hypothetical protein